LFTATTYKKFSNIRRKTKRKQHHSASTITEDCLNQPNIIHILFTFWRKSYCERTSLQNALYW